MVPFLFLGLKNTTVTLYEITFLRKGGLNTSFFYHLSMPFYVHQYKSLGRAQIPPVNLTLLLYLFLKGHTLCHPQSYMPHNCLNL